MIHSILPLALAVLVSTANPSANSAERERAFYYTTADKISALADQQTNYRGQSILLNSALRLASFAQKYSATDGECEEAWYLAEGIESKLSYCLEQLPEGKAAIALSRHNIREGLATIDSYYWRIEPNQNFNQMRLLVRNWQESFTPIVITLQINPRTMTVDVVPPVDVQEPGPYSSMHPIARGNVSAFIEDLRHYVDQ